MAFSNQPENLNQLSPLGFRFVLNRTPTVTYFCQQAPIPGISIPEVPQMTPTLSIPLPGTPMTFEPFNIRFKVDEDMVNWMEIFNWMNGLAFPGDTNAYKSLVGGVDGPIRNGLSDGRLIVSTNQHNPSISVSFYDMWPTNLSQIDFDTTHHDVEYMEAEVTFRYRNYTVASVA